MKLRKALLDLVRENERLKLENQRLREQEEKKQDNIFLLGGLHERKKDIKNSHNFLKKSFPPENVHPTVGATTGSVINFDDESKQRFKKAFNKLFLLQEPANENSESD